HRTCGLRREQEGLQSAERFQNGTLRHHRHFGQRYHGRTGLSEKPLRLFCRPGNRSVTSLYRSSRVHGAVTALEALGFTAEMIPNVLAAEKLEGLSFALGASMAVRRKALESIGGFRSLVDYLADDYQLGYLIHRAGWRIKLSGDFVESVLGKESFSSILSRQIRWCRTMRVSRPGGYLASGIVHPVTGLVIFLLAADFTVLTLVSAAL